MKTKLLFFGSSEFAVPILQSILTIDRFEITGVVTQPDKPTGRHQSELQPTPVKKLILDEKLDLKIFQPQKIKTEFQSILDESKPELIVVAAYGQILPKELLDYPKYKSINIHGSLLPELRGAVPVQFAILKGFKKTGVTIQLMEEKMDAGDVIAQSEVDINQQETYGELLKRLALSASELIKVKLPEWVDGKVIPIPQDESRATYCFIKDVTKDKAKINWELSASEIDRIVRAFNPDPVAWTQLRDSNQKNEWELEAASKFAGKRLLIYKTRVLNDTFVSLKGGKLFKHGKKLLARAGKGWIEIVEAQLEGKTKMSGNNLLFLAEDTTTKVRAVVIHDNKLLMIKRRKKGYHKEYYVLPGGGVGVNESLHEAVIREVKEETGINVQVKEQIMEPETQENVTTNIFFSAEVVGEPGELVVEGEEKLYDPTKNYYEPVWIEIEKLDTIDTYKSIKNYIKTLNK